MEKNPDALVSALLPFYISMSQWLLTAPLSALASELKVTDGRLCITRRTGSWRMTENLLSCEWARCQERWLYESRSNFSALGECLRSHWNNSRMLKVIIIVHSRIFGFKYVPIRLYLCFKFLLLTSFYVCLLPIFPVVRISWVLKLDFSPIGLVPGWQV